MNALPTPVLIALIAAVATVVAALGGIILKHLIEERTRKKDQTRKAIEAIHPKLKEYEESMVEVLKNAVPAHDPYNSERVNATRAKREEFERALEVQKIHLPDKIVKEIKETSIAISRVVLCHGTAREMRGTPDGKARYEDLQIATDDSQKKMKCLEKKFQKLI